jgi:glycosyltransferase involved in cell wall biosynthesis
MKFSIVTATKNSEQFLQENIDSVKTQTFRDFEHIFIDGNSTDRTIEIIEEYQKEFPEKVRVYQFPPEGISHAMNKGIEKSQGEYIDHLHADDSLYDKNVLKDVDNFLKESNMPDWIYGLAHITEENGETVGVYPNKPWLYHHDSDSFLGKHLLRLTNFIPHQTVFIKKDVFERYGKFDEKLSSKMDPDLWLRIVDKTSWKFFNRKICNYRIHKNAQSSSKKNIKENRKNLAKVQKRHLKFWELPLARLLNLVKSTINKTLR